MDRKVRSERSKKATYKAKSEPVVDKTDPGDSSGGSFANRHPGL